MKNYTKMLQSKVNQCRGSNKIITPKTLDYRNMGVVTKVKNQYGCSSCFIFSAIATVESAYLLKKKNQTGKNQTDFEPLYSEQAVLDCCDPGSCIKGGLPHHTFDILKKNGVIDENVAPYTDSVNKKIDL